MILQNENANQIVSDWIDYDDDRPSVRVSFKKYWSDSLYPCQNMSDYGIRFNKVPILHNRYENTRLIWKVSVLVSRVESLWRMISNYYELRSSNWHGWMLAFLYKKCFNQGNSRKSKTDPFKSSISIERFREKVQRHRLSSYFKDELLPEIYFIDLPTDFDGELLLNLFFSSQNQMY